MAAATTTTNVSSPSGARTATATGGQTAGAVMKHGSATASAPASTTVATTSATPKGIGTEWIMPIAAVGLIFVMLVPVPSLLLDLLLALSMTAAVLVLLSAIQILRPSQFSVFPSLLLLLTLFRLSLNLASSRRGCRGLRRREP